MYLLTLVPDDFGNVLHFSVPFPCVQTPVDAVECNISSVSSSKSLLHCEGSIQLEHTGCIFIYMYCTGQVNALISLCPPTHSPTTITWATNWEVENLSFPPWGRISNLTSTDLKSFCCGVHCQPSPLLLAAPAKALSSPTVEGNGGVDTFDIT